MLWSNQPMSSYCIPDIKHLFSQVPQGQWFGYEYDGRRRLLQSPSSLEGRLPRGRAVSNFARVDLHLILMDLSKLFPYADQMRITRALVGPSRQDVADLIWELLDRQHRVFNI